MKQFSWRSIDKAGVGYNWKKLEATVLPLTYKLYQKTLPQMGYSHPLIKLNI